MFGSEAEPHPEAVNSFIELANVVKDEGISTHVVSSATVATSTVYATYVAVGNEGGLTDSGVEKVVDAYRDQMEQVQAVRKA